MVDGEGVLISCFPSTDPQQYSPPSIIQSLIPTIFLRTPFLLQIIFSQPPSPAATSYHLLLTALHRRKPTVSLALQAWTSWWWVSDDAFTPRPLFLGLTNHGPPLTLPTSFKPLQIRLLTFSAFLIFFSRNYILQKFNNSK